MNTLTIQMPRLHVGNRQAVIGGLTLYPIWTEAPLAERRYRLPEPGRLDLVAEHEDGPRVQELILDNSGDEPLLVLEGMTLDGGWQHRVVTRSILVGAGQRTAIPVRCIEQSRWNGQRSQSFSTFDAPAAMRSALRSLKSDASGFEPDQGEVWSNVENYERTSGHRSRTHSLHEVQRRAAEQLEEQLRAARPLPGQRGVVVAASGHPMLAEVCDHPDTLAQRWDALLSGLALDAATAAPAATPGHRVRTFVRRMGRAAPQPAAPIGIGWSVEARDHDIVSLRGIADDTALLHAVALNPRHELVLAA